MKSHPNETSLFRSLQQGPSHPMTRPRITKNVVVLSVGCLVLFTAYEGFSMLQSTVNSEQGIGVISQAVLYICFCVSALVFPKYVIKRLGSKLTLVLSMLCYIPYIAANVYPHWAVMMPTSILIGFGAALLWGSQANYLNDVSVLYAELLLVSEERTENGKEESCSIYKQAMGGCVHESVDCPLERKETGVGVLTSPQESGPSNTDGHRLSSSGDQCTCKSKRDGQNLNCEQNILEQSNAEGLENLGKDVVEGNITTTRENLPSNLDGPGVGLSNGSQYSCVHKHNGQYPNSEQTTKKISNGLNNEGFISNEDTESEHSCRRRCADSKCGLKRIYSIPLPNDSARSPSNIGKDIKLKQKDSSDSINIELNQEDSVLKCLHSLDKAIDLNRKSTIESENIRRKQLIESTTARFFGFHGMVYLSSFIWSNLLSYFLLRHDSQTGRSTCACGSDFCDADPCHRQNDIQVMSDSTRYVLTGVCVCLGLFAVLFVWLLLDPLDDKSGGGNGFDMRLLTATLKLAKRTELVLLMPISLYLGMASAFFAGDINKSFTSCALGVSSVGLVGATYGAGCALSSFLSGWAVRKAGRTALFTVSAVLNSASCVLLLAWTPDAELPFVFYVAAGMWGLYVGSAFSQIRAFYGVLFKADEEAAFATFHTWYSLGFFISFVYSIFLCAYVKIYVLIAVSTAGFAGYLVVERRHATGNITALSSCL